MVVSVIVVALFTVFYHKIFAVTYDEIKEKKYSLAAGQYFDVKIEYVELSQDEFNARMNAYAEKLQEYFAEGDKLKTEIMEQLKKVKYE